MSDQTTQLTVVPAAKAPRISAAVAASIVVPAIIADAGEHATRRFLEFFAATIRNRNTRTAYLHAANRFFAWCEHHQLGQLADIEPLHVAAYIEALGKNFEKPTVKQHLAAIRMLFDSLVTGQIVATNPAHSVRNTLSRPARRRCWTPNRHANCWTASTPRPWSGYATGR
jgi:hypothetical protein